MNNRMVGYIFIFPLVLCMVFLFGWFVNEQYQATKKHFPEMTFWEYLLIGNSVRITPK